MHYDIYTDGAVSKNGQKGAIGGWAFLIVDENDKLIHKEVGCIIDTTNQQMELYAIIKACEFCEENLFIKDECSFEIFSDSAYAVSCFKDNWYKGWQNNGWVTANRTPVKNKELWQNLIPFFENKYFNFTKVKGHSGNRWNEQVDELAVNARSIFL